MIELFKLVLGLARSFFRPDAELILENLALRHQLPRPREPMAVELSCDPAPTCG
jgi:hypothetical protein